MSLLLAVIIRIEEQLGIAFHKVVTCDGDFLLIILKQNRDENEIGTKTRWNHLDVCCRIVITIDIRRRNSLVLKLSYIAHPVCAIIGKSKILHCKVHQWHTVALCTNSAHAPLVRFIGNHTVTKIEIHVAYITECKISVGSKLAVPLVLFLAVSI